MEPYYIEPQGNDVFLIKDSASDATLGKIVKKSPIIRNRREIVNWTAYTATKDGKFQYLGYHNYQQKSALAVYKVARYRGVI